MTTHGPEPVKWLTLKEVVAMMARYGMDVSRNTLVAAIERGTLTGRQRVGRRWQVPEHEVKELLSVDGKRRL